MERPDGMGRPGGRAVKPEGEDGIMPAPPDFGGAPPEFGSKRESGEPDQLESEQPEDAQQEPDASLLVEGVETGPQPVSSETRRMIGACFLVLTAGILFVVKYKV